MITSNLTILQLIYRKETYYSTNKLDLVGVQVRWEVAPNQQANIHFSKERGMRIMNEVYVFSCIRGLHQQLRGWRRCFAVFTAEAPAAVSFLLETVLKPSESTSMSES
jgi:hypothetical protein